MRIALRRRAPSPGHPHRPPSAPRGVRGLLSWLSDLARRRRRIRPTREGWVFLGSTLAVALAALNTGNNLLYLVFATQLAMVALSGVLSELSIQQIQLGRRLSGRAFAEVPLAGSWQLRNPRRWLPNFAITVREAAGPGAALAGSPTAQAPLLAPGAHAALATTWCFERRGRHQLRGIRVATTWPFGIFEKYFELRAPLEVLVHPRPAPGTELPRDEAERRSGARIGARRGDDELLGLRDHRVGDDPRLLHWKSSARLGRLVAVERARTEGGEVVVLVPDPPPGPERAERFEESLRRATRAVLSACAEQRPVELLLPGAAPLRAALGSEAALLEALALAELP